MKATAVDHISIAVRSLEESRRAYEETLGLEPALEYTDENEKIRVVRYYLGEVALELMEDTDGTGNVARFIEKRGEGVFLVSYRVEDVEAALGELQDRGIAAIDRKPRKMRGIRYAFIQSPRELGGVLTEIMDGAFDRES